MSISGYNKLNKLYGTLLDDISFSAIESEIIDNFWVDGSLALKNASKGSNINLCIKFKDEVCFEKREDFLKKLPVIIFGEYNSREKVNILKALSRIGIWLDIEIWHEGRKMPKYCIDLKDVKNKFKEEGDFVSEFSVIPPVEDNILLQERLYNNIMETLIKTGNLVVGINRNDIFAILMLFDEIRELLVKTIVFIAKNGSSHDMNRIGDYLHFYYKELILNSYLDKTLFLENDFEIFKQKIEEKYSCLAELLSLVIYQYNLLFDPFPNKYTEAIKELLFSQLSWDINFSSDGDARIGLYDEPGIADQYDKARYMSNEFNIGIMSLVNKWLKDKSVLELGAGTGRIGLQVIPYVKNYKGIELSTSMINIFKKKIKGLNFYNSEIIQGDAMQLSSNCLERYDVILEHEVLLFTLDPIIVTKQILNNLKDNGIFIRIVASREKDSTYNKLLNAFNKGVCSYLEKPFVIKGVGTDSRVTYYLHKHKIKTQKEQLSSWNEKVYIKDLIRIIKSKPFPYMKDLSEDVINIGIDQLYKEVRQMGLEVEDSFIDKRELYCFISKK